MLRPMSLRVDADGNAVITGTFQGTVDFGAGPLRSAQPDTFVAKFDPSGQLVCCTHLDAATADPPEEPVDGAFTWMQLDAATDADGDEDIEIDVVVELEPSPAPPRCMALSRPVPPPLPPPIRPEPTPQHRLPPPLPPPLPTPVDSERDSCSPVAVDADERDSFSPVSLEADDEQPPAALRALRTRRRRLGQSVGVAAGAVGALTLGVLAVNEQGPGATPASAAQLDPNPPAATTYSSPAQPSDLALAYLVEQSVSSSASLAAATKPLHSSRRAEFVAAYGAALVHQGMIETAAEAAAAQDAAEPHGTVTELRTEVIQLLIARKPAEAQRWAEALIAAAPQHALGYLAYGAASQDLGELDRARRVYDACVANAVVGDPSECYALGGRKR